MVAQGVEPSALATTTTLTDKGPDPGSVTPAFNNFSGASSIMSRDESSMPSEGQSCRIFIRYSNFPKALAPTEDEIRNIFSKYGTIIDVDRRPKFCFLEYADGNCAKQAVNGENGTTFKDKPLEVEIAVATRPKKPTVIETCPTPSAPEPGKSSFAKDEWLAHSAVLNIASTEDTAPHKHVQSPVHVAQVISETPVKECAASESERQSGSPQTASEPEKVDRNNQSHQLSQEHLAGQKRQKSSPAVRIVLDDSHRVKDHHPSPSRDNAETGLEWLQPSRRDVLPDQRKRHRNDPSSSQDVSPVHSASRRERHRNDPSPLRDVSPVHSASRRERHRNDPSPLRDVSPVHSASRRERHRNDPSPLRDVSPVHSTNKRERHYNKFNDPSPFRDISPLHGASRRERHPTNLSSSQDSHSEQSYRYLKDRSHSQDSKKDYSHSRCRSRSPLQNYTMEQLHSGHKDISPKRRSAHDRERELSKDQSRVSADTSLQTFSGCNVQISSSSTKYTEKFEYAHRKIESRPPEHYPLNVNDKITTDSMTKSMLESSVWSRIKDTLSGLQQPLGLSNAVSAELGKIKSLSSSAYDVPFEKGIIGMDYGANQGLSRLEQPLAADWSRYMGFQNVQQPVIGETSVAVQNVACEIFIREVVSREYATQVAMLIEKNGLTVRVSMLPHGTDIFDEIDRAMNRKTLFAMFLADQESITVYILHGEPEEHRNVLLADAIRLIVRSYMAYMSQKNVPMFTATVPTSPSSSASTTLPPDPDTHRLLGLLAADCELSVEELEQVVRYLQCRVRVLKAKRIAAANDIQQHGSASDTRDFKVVGKQSIVPRTNRNGNLAT